VAKFTAILMYYRGLSEKRTTSCLTVYADDMWMVW